MALINFWGKTDTIRMLSISDPQTETRKSEIESHTEIS